MCNFNRDYHVIERGRQRQRPAQPSCSWLQGRAEALNQNHSWKVLEEKVNGHKALGIDPEVMKELTWQPSIENLLSTSDLKGGYSRDTFIDHQHYQ